MGRESIVGYSRTRNSSLSPSVHSNSSFQQQHHLQPQSHNGGGGGITNGRTSAIPESSALLLSSSSASSMSAKGVLLSSSPSPNVPLIATTSSTLQRHNHSRKPTSDDPAAKHQSDLRKIQLVDKFFEYVAAERSKERQLRQALLNEKIKLQRIKIDLMSKESSEKRRVEEERLKRKRAGLKSRGGGGLDTGIDHSSNAEEVVSVDTNNGASTNNNPASSGTAISGNLTALDSLNPESLSGGAVAMGNMTRDEQHLDESFKQHPHATSSSNASAAAIGAGGVAATTSADSVLAEEGGVVGEREFNGRAPAPSVTKRISTNTITTTTSKKLFKGNYYFIQKKDMEDTRKALLDPRVRHIRPSTYPTKTSTTAASALNEGGKSSKKSDPSMTDAELEEIQDSVAPLSSKDKPLTKSKKNLPGPAPSRTRISVVQGSSGLRRSRRGRNSVRGRGGDDAKQQEMDKSNASVVVFNSERGWADFKHKYTIELMREETMHEEEKQKPNMLEGFREALQKSNHRKKYMFMNTFRNKNKTAHHITTLEDVIVPINASDENGNRIETETRVHPLLAFSESPIRKWLKGDDKRQLEVEDEQLRMKNAEKTKRQQEDYIGPEKTGLNSIRMTDSMIGHVSSIDDDDATAATATAAADTDAASTATAARIQEDGKPDNKIAEQAIAVALGDCTSFANVPFETKPTPQLVSSSGDSPGTADSSTTKASAPSTAASASEKVPHSSDRPPSSLKKPGSQKKQLRAIFSDVLQQEETSERKETTGQQRSGSGGSSRSSFHQEVREEEEEKQEGETDPALASIIKDIKSMISAPSSNAAAAGGINNNNSPGATKNPASKPPTYTIEQLEKLEKSLLLDDNAEGGLNKTLAALTAVQTTQLKNTTPSTKSLDDDKTPQKSRTLLSSRPADFAGDDDFVIPAGNDVKTPNTNSSATTTNTPAAHKRILQLDRLRDAQRTAYPFRRDLSIIKRWEPLNISAISDMRQTVFGTKFTANGLKDVSSLPPIKSTAERWGAEDYEVKRQLGEVAKFSMTQDFWNIIRFSAEED